MNLSPLHLSPRLSRASWFFIEFFALFTIFLLPFSKSAAEIGITVCLILWVFRKFPWDEPFPRARIVNAAYALFFLLTVLSLAHVSPELRATAFHGLEKWAKHLLIFFMALDYFRDKKRTERFIGVFLISTALLCADGFIQMLTGHDFVKHNAADIPGRLVRMQASLNSPNDLAAFLLLGLPVVFFLWLEEKKWSLKSTAMAALLTVMGVAFITTLSRGALLALLISAVFYALAKRKRKILWLLPVLPAIFLLSPMLRYNFIGSLGTKNITVLERLELWKTALRMIQAHPLVGNGVNLFVEKYASFSGTVTQYKGYAHNCYLQMAAEIGIPGLLVFLVPLLAVLPKAIFGSSQKTALQAGLLVGIPAFLLQAALDTNFYALQAAMLFWWFWGMCCALELGGTGG